MSDRLSAEVLANLSAVRDGKPWPHPDVPVPLWTISIEGWGDTSRSTLTVPGAAVLAMADAGAAVVGGLPHLVALSDSSLEALKDLGRNVQPETFYMAPDWAVEPDQDAVGERPPMRLTQAGKAWLAERVARMSNMADARVNALDNRVREIFTEPITVEEGIERLVRERADLRKRMADTDAFVAAWAKGAEAACARQPLSACPHTDQYLIDAWTGGYAHEGWIPGGVLAVEREAEIRAEVLRPAPDDLLGQRLLNGRASLPDDTPTWVGALLDEALGAIQALRADGRAKAAQLASTDAEIERLVRDVGDVAALRKHLAMVQDERAKTLASLRVSDDQRQDLVCRQEMICNAGIATACDALMSQLRDILYGEGASEPALTLQGWDVMLAEVERLTDERAAIPTPLRRFVGRIIDGDMDLNSVTIQLTAPDAVAGVTIGSSVEAMTLQAEIARLTVERATLLAPVEGVDVEEVKRLRSKLCEASLTLAAEIGKPEGAPSSRWTSDGHNWYGSRPDGGMDKVERWSNLNGDGTIKHCRGWTDIDRFGFEKEVSRFNFAREAMLAADARLASYGGGPDATFST